MFFNTQVIIAEGMRGKIRSFIESVRDLNDGESWSKFEGAIIQPTALSYELNRASFKNPNIQSLYGNGVLSGNVSDMSGGYEIAKKGDSRHMAELIYMLNYGCNNGAGNEERLCDMIIASEGRSIDNFNLVQKYLLFIASSLNCMANTSLNDKQKPISKEGLRNLVLLLDMITNPLNAMNHSVLFKIRSLKDIKQPTLFCEEFIKWDKNRKDKKINPQDFGGAKNNPIPDTYAFANQGHNPSNIQERMKYINYEYIKENYEKWTAESYVSDSTVNYKSWENYLKAKNNYIDPYNKADPVIDLRSKVHVDHIKPRKKGGTNEPENLTVTNPTSNLIKGARY